MKIVNIIDFRVPWTASKLWAGRIRTFVVQLYGTSWIPESDFESIDCDYIALSYCNESGKIIGYNLGFESCTGPEMIQRICWLEDIFVDEKERGKGIGRKMISKMAKKRF